MFKKGGINNTPEGLKVQKLQKQLVNAGYNIKVDGWLGPKTKAALDSYNKNENITRNDNPLIMDWNKIAKRDAARKAEINKAIIQPAIDYTRKLSATADKNLGIKARAEKKANAKVRVPMAPNNDAKLQDALWRAGAYNTVRTRSGKSLTYQQAVDGIFGKMSEQALKNAEDMGFVVDRKSGTITRKISSSAPKRGLAAMREMTHAARTGGMSTIPTNSSTSPALEANGHAIYLHYPNFVGNSKNAFKIGDFDPGEVVGNPQLSVGHAATILIDDKGNANYYEYGRYEPSNGHLIGTEQRATVKGGNWRQFKLPKQKAGENDSVYVSRIQKMLPDTKTGAYQAMTIPSVDVRRATKFIQNEANNKNRKEYGIFNTCATGACNATLDFRKDKLNNKEHADNRTGYSEAALSWARLPFTTDSYATKARKAASKVYIMNN